MAFMQKVINMEDKKVSIIMPAYNVEKYIEDAIQSVLAQTYRNFELLIINDGSTDDTERICGKYASSDDRVLLFSTSNKGVSAARNYGLEHASGEYLLFLDSDDYISSECLSTLVKIKNETKADVVVSSFITVYEKQSNIKSISKKKNIKLSGKEFVRNVVGYLSIGAYVWGKLFDAEVFNSIRFPEGRIWEDSMVVPYILYPLDRVIFCIDQLWFYRVRKGSIMNSYSDIRTDEIDSYQQLIDFGEKENDRVLVWGAKRWYVRSVKYFKIICRKYNNGNIPSKIKPYIQISRKYKREIIKGYFCSDIRQWAIRNLGRRWNE